METSKFNGIMIPTTSAILDLLEGVSYVANADGSVFLTWSNDLVEDIQTLRDKCGYHKLRDALLEMHPGIFNADENGDFTVSSSESVLLYFFH